MGLLEDREQLKHLREIRDSRELVHYSGMWMSRKMMQELKSQTCPGACDKSLPPTHTYFGEKFCERCYHTMKRGERP